MKLFIVIYGLLQLQVLRTTNTMFYFLIIIPIFCELFLFFASLKCVIFLCYLINLSILNLSFISDLFYVIMGVNLIIKYFTNFVLIWVSLSVFLVLKLISKWKFERKIITINNIIRNLLCHASFLPYFWPHALNTACYLLNILPSKLLRHLTPIHMP